MILRVVIISLLLLLVIRAIRLLLAGVFDGTSGGGGRSQAPPVKLVRDPVCGTHVSPRTALSLTAKGTTHYFCSEECRGKYRGR